MTALPAIADLDTVVSFHVDPDAPVGDVLPALAALLIGMHRRQREGNPIIHADGNAIAGPDEAVTEVGG